MSKFLVLRRKVEPDKEPADVLKALFDGWRERNRTTPVLSHSIAVCTRTVTINGEAVQETTAIVSILTGEPIALPPGDPAPWDDDAESTSPRPSAEGSGP